MSRIARPIPAHPQMLDDLVSRRIGRVDVLVWVCLEHDPTQQRPHAAQRIGDGEA